MRVAMWAQSIACEHGSAEILPSAHLKFDTTQVAPADAARMIAFQR